MISRLTSFAVAFAVTSAVVAAASLAFAAEARQDREAARAQVPVVQLERVVISAKRAI